MQSIPDRLKKEWRVIVMAVWMVGVTAYLIHLHGVVRTVRQTSMQLQTDLQSLTGLLISTDSNVSEIREQVNDMAAKVTVMHQRIRRR